MEDLKQKFNQLKTLVKSAWPFRATRTAAWFFAVLTAVFAIAAITVALKFLPYLVALAFFAVAGVICYLIASVLFEEDGHEDFKGL